jgi:antitoxin (DNA-binding transcriptional repressor) of toxin-antitoxin stability system
VIQTVNIRVLKDKLSAYLRLVERGDVVLVSDRGTVIAELRQPTLHQAAMNAAQGRLQQLAETGGVRLGLPNTPEAYRSAESHLSAAAIDEALAATRGDR